MKWFLSIVFICVAVFVIVPFAAGAGFGIAGGSMDVQVLSNVNEFEVSGDGNQVVPVAGDHASVTTVVTEPSVSKTSNWGLADYLAGGLQFLGLAVLFIAGMAYYGRL